MLPLCLLGLQSQGKTEINKYISLLVACLSEDPPWGDLPTPYPPGMVTPIPSIPQGSDLPTPGVFDLLREVFTYPTLIPQ